MNGRKETAMRAALAAGLLAAALGAFVFGAAGARAAGDAPTPPSQDWSFGGVRGTFDRAQLQRGLKVYTAVCANCHGLKLVAYRNLVEIGLTPNQAKAVAAQKKITEIGPDGQPKERPAELKDRFVSPFANDELAKTANNNALPPDLSLIVKARQGGTDYIYALLTGYAEPPKDWKDEEGKPRKLETGQFYNKFFPGHVIAMAPPLTGPDLAEYPKDGPKATVEQMARDVVAFLAWASDPTMELRKRTGIKVILFLLLMTGVFYAGYRRVWRKVH